MTKNKGSKLDKKLMISAVAILSLFWGAYQESKEENNQSIVDDGAKEVPSPERRKNNDAIPERCLTELSEPEKQQLRSQQQQSQQQSQQQQELNLYLSVGLCIPCCD
ncbi:hypothetical protein HWQ46_09825 [Shewanella sp. D64]|uniref:hypothetical protein n=1 Tax=unclassified Shewanella TaxID=196818 RepID=UPI0022BA6C31|nr:MULTISPECIES: hypothetical protein [unclassified Shewanella]MEC4725841.1 hypothetical protein [Shewanella sp. D64]MEC4737552.1 hypothetical protein [Shewanella sp. E94]WBJ93370.1 hypothetical protein HWQ47_15660 [Shewanella sp. MTB7]